MGQMNPLKQHPNAIVGGLGGGTGIGYAVLQILASNGVHLSSKQSGLLASGCAIAVLLLARPAKYVWAHGFTGVWSRLKGGKAAGATAPRKASAAPAGVVTVAIQADTSAFVASIADARARVAELAADLAKLAHGDLEPQHVEPPPTEPA